MKKIFIDIEIINREFDGKLLLAASLAKEGFVVYVGRKSAIAREILFHKHSIYLAKSISPERLEFYSKLKECGHKIFLLDVEGGVFHKDPSKNIIMRYQENVIGYLDKAFLFGEKTAELLIEHLVYSDKINFIITGDPRFDLLKPQFSTFYEKDVKQISKRYGEFIIVNTSFALGNPRMGYREQIDYINNNKDLIDSVRDQYLELVEEHKYLLDKFTELIRLVAIENKGIKIIIRPHPAENVSTYHKNLDMENVIITNEGNVQKWILASRAVIHFDCTTGIEAVMAGKPVISYRPKGANYNIHPWLPTALSIEARTVDDVLGQLNKIFCGYNPKLSIDQEKLLKGYFSNYYQNAYEKITDEFLKEDFTRPTHVNIAQIPKFVMYRLKMYFKSVIKHKDLMPPKEIEYKINLIKRAMQTDVCIKSFYGVCVFYLLYFSKRIN